MDGYIATVVALMKRAAALPIIAANPQAAQRVANAITDVSRLREIGVDDVRLLVQLVEGKLGEVQDAVAIAKAGTR
jgi:hypothetical protein